MITHGGHQTRRLNPRSYIRAPQDQLLAALPHDTLPEQRDRALILLLLSTGARISEILRLDRSNWKPERLWVLGKGDRDGSSRSPTKRGLRSGVPRRPRGPLPRPVHRLPTRQQDGQLQPSHHRRRPARLPPARPATRHPGVSPPPAPPHTSGPCSRKRWATPGSPPKHSATAGWRP
jgi:integrase